MNGRHSGTSIPRRRCRRLIIPLLLPTPPNPHVPPAPFSARRVTAAGRLYLLPITDCWAWAHCRAPPAPTAPNLAVKHSHLQSGHLGKLQRLRNDSPTAR